MTNSPQNYRRQVQEFLAAAVYPHVERFEQQRIFPREVIRQLGAAALLSPCYHFVDGSQPRRLPLNLATFRILIEELAKTRCFGLTLAISVHAGVFVPLIIRLATPTVRERIVPAALNGTLLGTIASTEYDAPGSDFLGMHSTCQLDGPRISLHGHKHYITNITEADYVIVFARWQPGRHFTNFCALLVPTDLPGIRRMAIPMAVMKTATIGRIEFDQVELDPAFLLGRRGLGFQYFLQHIAAERLSGGIWATAVAEECLAETQRYASQHIIDGQTLWDRGAIQHRLAQAVVQIMLLRALVDKTIAEADGVGIIDDLASAAIKAAVAPMMEEIIGICLQLRGARGLEEHSPLLRNLNDFRVFGIGGGSTETMLDLIATLWAQACATPIAQAE